MRVLLVARLISARERVHGSAMFAEDIAAIRIQGDITQDPLDVSHPAA